jgi:hypothetical protein
MASIFSNNPLQGDVWDMQGAVINFGSSTQGGNATSGPTSTLQNGMVIALGLSMSFSRGLTKRFPINVRRVIYMLGNPEGQITVNCLFGPGNAMQNFITKFSHLGANQSTLNLAGGTSNTQSKCSITIIPFGKITYSGAGSGVGNNTTLGLGTWIINDPVLTSIGLTINEGGAQGSTAAIAQVTLTFNNLQIN